MKKILTVLCLILFAYAVTGEVAPSANKGSLQVEVKKTLAALEQDYS